MSEKVIRNGKVAVAYSPGFGAGWTTWNEGRISPFEPKVIAMIEAGRQGEIDNEWCNRELGLEGYVCCLAASDLEIGWVREGESFRIDEYDGSESIVTKEDFSYSA